MRQCKQCGQDYEPKRSTSLYCSPKCKQASYRNTEEPVTVTSVTLKEEPVTVTDKPDVTLTPPCSDRSGQPTRDNLVRICLARAKQGKPWRQGDPVWPYTRHLTPIESIAWCRQYKPSWLTAARPGDEDYNWSESAVPVTCPAHPDYEEPAA